VRDGEEEPGTQPRARVQDRLYLRDGQGPRQLCRDLQRDRPATIRHALAGMGRERFPPAPSASPPRGQQVTDLRAVSAWCAYRAITAARSRLTVTAVTRAAADASALLPQSSLVTDLPETLRPGHAGGP
jgi:hypothetical protein